MGDGVRLQTRFALASVTMATSAFGGCASDVADPRCSVSDATFADAGESLRDGSTVLPVTVGPKFEIPAPWMVEHRRYGGNIHLTRAELAAVEHGSGDWNTELATVTNALLPFDRCVAQIGEQSWVDGTVYTALHVRTYLLQGPPPDFTAMVSGGTFEGVDSPTVEPVDSPWDGLRIAFEVVYGDYGGTANVELHHRTVGDATVVQVGMWGALPDAPAMIDIVESTCLADAAGNCCEDAGD